MKKTRKMISIPADTHDKLFEFLSIEEERNGLKITASSFVDAAIKVALIRKANKEWSIDKTGV